MKAELIKKLNDMVDEYSSDDRYSYRVKITEWMNYGKNRTYFSIVKTGNVSKHYSEKKYGYYDNITNEYVADKYGDLTRC